MTPSPAQDLSQFLDTVKDKVASFNSERQQLAQSLRQIVSQAQQLLSDLGESAITAVRGRRGRPSGTGSRRGRPAGAKKGARKGRRKMSAAARKAISKAQKKRWAAQKASKK